MSSAQFRSGRSQARPGTGPSRPARPRSWWCGAGASAQDNPRCSALYMAQAHQVTARNPDERLRGANGGLEDLEEEVRVPAGGLAPRLDAALACGGPHQIEGEAAHDRPVLGPMPAAVA